MGTKRVQMCWLLLAAAFTAASAWLVRDGAVSAALAWTFTCVTGLFLGLDIAAMLCKTRAMDAGWYKGANKHRYVAALCVFALLLGEAFWLSAARGRDVDALYLCYGVGFLLVIGGLVGGIEANKMATRPGGGGGAAEMKP